MPLFMDIHNIDGADHTGRERKLSEFWTGQPALLMFWRHFGCACGVDRAERLRTEYQDYLGAGLNPVIVAQGEPERAALGQDADKMAAESLGDYYAFLQVGRPHPVGARLTAKPGLLASQHLMRQLGDGQPRRGRAPWNHNGQTPLTRRTPCQSPAGPAAPSPPARPPTTWAVQPACGSQ